MKLKYVVLAEGMAQDARGALTVLGLNQNVQVVTELPVPTKRAIIAYLDMTDAEFTDGPFAITFSVISPSGKTVMANSSQGTFQPHPWKIPPTVTVMGEFSFPVDELGEYELRVSVRSDKDDGAEGRVGLYVVNAS